MKSKFFIIVWFTIILVSFVSAYKYEETIKKTVSIDQEGTLKLANINGSINITTFSGNEVKIEARQMADSKEEFENIEIGFVSEGNKLDIMVEKKEKSCKVYVDFNLKVPERLKSVDLLTILGDIEVEGDYRELKLKTVNGQIDFEGNFTRGDFNTVSDDIVLYIEDDLQGDMQAKTYNGDIKVELDSDSSFVIEAFAVNGNIRNEFKLFARKVAFGRKLKGTINKGQHKVYLKSQNGSIKVLKK